MTTHPRCRYCGKPLAKRTKTFWCYPETPHDRPVLDDHIVGVFRSKEEVQRITNQQVVSVRYHPDNEYHRERGIANTVWLFSTWDGESYDSVYGQGYFDTQTCAVHFANLFARAGKTTTDYAAAVEREHKQEKNHAVQA